MKKVRRGFTLVEVSIFLVITAAIFVGVAVGTQNSIFQQRYNDTVQNFVEFLRTVYSQVTNVQSESNGTSEKAIYGKLVVFGKSNNNNEIKTYNVIGDIENIALASGNDVLKKLETLNINIVHESGKTDNNGNKIYETVGFEESYAPRWGSQIQTINGWFDGYEIYEGTLLIVRSPDSGTIYTYSMNKAIDVDEALKSGSNPFIEGDINYLIDSNDGFRVQDVDFCINPNGAGESNLRRDVRIIKNARNSSGIEIISDDKEEVHKIVNGHETDEMDNIGNRCE